MIYVSTFLISIILFFFFTVPAYAIIVVVPAILIPIVNIVVWIIGAITVPVIAISAYIYKARRNNLIVGVFMGILLLLLLGVAITFAIKIIDPQRPLYNNNF